MRYGTFPVGSGNSYLPEGPPRIGPDRLTFNVEYIDCPNRIKLDNRDTRLIYFLYLLTLILSLSVIEQTNFYRIPALELAVPADTIPKMLIMVPSWSPCGATNWWSTSECWRTTTKEKVILINYGVVNSNDRLGPEDNRLDVGVIKMSPCPGKPASCTIDQLVSQGYRFHNIANGAWTK